MLGLQGGGDHERLRRLPGQRPPRGVGDGAGEHHRHPLPALPADGVGGPQRRLGVERVKDRLDQQQVGPAGQQRPGLVGIRLVQLGVGDGPELGTLHVRGEGGGPVRGPHRPGHPTGPAVGGGGLVSHLPGQPRRRPVQLRHQLLGPVVGLGDGGGGERVGGGDVGASLEVSPVHIANEVGTGHLQQVEVAAITARRVSLREAEIVLGELELLEQRAPGAVQDQDALASHGAKIGSGCRWGGHSHLSCHGCGLPTRSGWAWGRHHRG